MVADWLSNFVYTLLTGTHWLEEAPPPIRQLLDKDTNGHGYIRYGSRYKVS